MDKNKINYESKTIDRKVVTGVDFLYNDLKTPKEIQLRFEHLGNITVRMETNALHLTPNFGEVISRSKYSDGLDIKFNLSLNFLDLVKKWLEMYAADEVLSFLQDREKENPTFEHEELLTKLTDCAKLINKLKSTVESMNGYYN